MLIPAGLLLFSGAGFLISLYFTLVTYRLVSPDQRYIPKFCRMTGNECAAIVDTRQARLLGVPNSVLGLGYYAGVFYSALAPSGSSTLFHEVLIALSALTVVMGIYLVYSLISILRVSCVLCLTSHLLNALIFGLLVAQLFD